MSSHVQPGVHELLQRTVCRADRLRTATTSRTGREDHQMDITYYAGMSLDGFIAKPNGDVSWLMSWASQWEKLGMRSSFRVSIAWPWDARHTR